AGRGRSPPRRQGRPSWSTRVTSGAGSPGERAMGNYRAVTAASPRTDPDVADELVATVRAFVERDVLPVASDLEHADAYPDALVARMREIGLFGATVPEEYGGLGLD